MKGEKCYYEKVDEERLDFLIARSDNILENEENGEYRSKKNIVDALIFYKKIEVDKRGYRKIIYKQPTEGCRYYCLKGAGLQSFPKEIRKFLSNNMFDDLDFKSCHPVILYHLFTNKNETVPLALEEYLEDREKFCRENKITKDDFLKILNKETYNGKNAKIRKLNEAIYGKERLVDKLKKENKTFYKKIEKKKQDKGETWNINGSFISHCLQRIENTLLDTLENYLTNNNIEVNVSIFDGCMVLKNDKITEDFLEKGREYIKAKTTFDIQIVKKDMQWTTDFTSWEKNKSEFYEEDDETYANSDGILTYDFATNKRLYDKCLIYNDKGKLILDEKAVIKLHEYLNNFICLIIGIPITYCYRYSTDEVYLMNKPQKILEIIRFGFYSAPAKFPELDWRNYVNRRTYTSTVFKPDEKKVKPTEYNLYKRPEYEVIDNIENMTLKDIAPTLDDYIYNVLSGGDEECQKETYNFYINYLAKMVQVGKTRQGIILKGEKGTGKSTFTLLATNIIGKAYFVGIHNMDLLMNQFNAHFERCILACIEEVSNKAGEYGPVQNLIKTLITEKKYLLQKKGVDTYLTDGSVNLVICTNGNNPVSITEDNRRFLVCEVSKCRQRDSKYFKQLLKEVSENIKKIRYFFYTYKFEDDLNSIRPTTKAEISMRNLNISSVEEFFNNFELAKEEFHYENKKKIINELRSKQYIYEEYIKFCKECGKSKPFEQKYFVVELEKHGLRIERHVNRDNKKLYYILGNLKNN